MYVRAYLLVSVISWRFSFNRITGLLFPQPKAAQRTAAPMSATPTVTPATRPPIAPPESFDELVFGLWTLKHRVLVDKLVVWSFVLKIEEQML